jgi:hypothetical protein
MQPFERIIHVSEFWDDIYGPKVAKTNKDLQDLMQIYISSSEHKTGFDSPAGASPSKSWVIFFFFGKYYHI